MTKTKEKALVSACLLGVRCRYDAKHKYATEIDTLKETVDLIPVCPEQLGGLPTPRPAAQIEGGDGHDVLAGRAELRQLETGVNVTSEFIRGAEAALVLARFYHVKRAYFKSRSPSCGCGEIMYYDDRVPGDGVTTALLKQEGIEVVPVEGIVAPPELKDKGDA